jgi:DNA repair protein RadA/Sms
MGGRSLGTSVLNVLSPAKRAELLKYASSNGKPGEVKKKPLFQLMSEIEEEEIDFLWAGRIPRGKLTDFSGDPGTGKSTVSLAIAAALSCGRALPFDKEPEAPLCSWIISAEDGAADTVKPRLRKLGADMSMIAIPHRDLNLTPSRIEANLIDQFLTQFPAAMLVLDPVIAYAGKRNTHNSSDVRSLLQPLMLIAEKHKTAIILIRYLNKGVQNKALYRGQGSIDFEAACRSMFRFAQDPQNDERRLIAQIKASVSGLQPTLEYFISKQNGEFRWGGETSETADEALGTGEPRKEREAQQLDSAKRFLEESLSNGSLPSNKLKEKAEQKGIAWRTVWRAKDALGIKARKERGSGEWWWRLS